MKIQRVEADALPQGHWWAIIEHVTGEVTILARDAHAERVARAVLLQRQQAV